MAQEVKIAGAIFPDVPSIRVPDSNDVYHAFVDPSVTTATAADVASGKVFIAADGTQTVGSGSSGNTATINNDVNFYDYDGTLVASYTAQEFSELTAMPSNPSHSGLTAQGWNWTLADAKTQVQDTGTCDIGQMFTTDDGSTRIYIELKDGRLHPYLGLGVNGTVSVSWGDGSASGSMTGTSISTLKYLDHTYALEGSYVITITVTSGKFQIRGSGSYTHLLKKAASSNANDSTVYFSAIKRVELGANVSFSTYAFYNAYNLESITLPTSVTSLPDGVFWNCYNLCNLIVPTSVTTIGTALVRNCSKLHSVSFPKQLTSFGSNFSYDTYGINRITIPSGVTSIPSNGFYASFGLDGVFLSNSVTTINAGGFQSCRAIRTVKMPTGLTTLGSYAFSGCISLTEIEIPSGVTQIDSTTFSGCRSLSTMTIPSGVTKIAANAFANCTGLAELHFLPTTPPTLAAVSAFTNLPTDCTIYVPSGSLSSYTSATNYPSSSTYTYVEE